MKQTLLQICAVLGFMGFSQLIQAQAGDTTYVQTFTFEEQNDPETAYDYPGRRTFEFPEDDGTEYQKILMYYTLKCFEDGTAGNLAYACGEWDYLSYTYLFDYTGLLDSTALEHPRYLADNADFEFLDLLDEELFNQIQYELNGFQLSADPEELEYAIGESTSSSDYPVASNHKGARSQFLYLPEELTAAGMTAGDYQKIAFQLSQVPENSNSWLRVQYKQVNLSSLDAFQQGGFSEIYSWTTQNQQVGLNVLELNSALTWDGNSAILLEVISETENPDESTTMDCELIEGDDNLSLFRAKGDGVGKYAEFSVSDQIKVPEEVFVDLDTEVTVAFWVNGFAELQPQNGTCFEGVNADNNRVLNSHLPWSNGRVYWDAGWDGGYDRIDKAAVEGNYEGAWNHWAFTKNTTTGSMKIYLNGNIWHSGSNLDNSLAGIVNFSIGAAAGWSNFYNGRIDEFQIWSKELDQATIQDWMRLPVDNSHPDYDNLLLQYHFNENNAEFVSSDGGVDALGVAYGSVNRKYASSSELYMDDMPDIAQESNKRPIIRFYQGDYTSTDVSETYTISEPVPPVSLAEYQVEGNTAALISITYVNPTATTYTFDENGEILDSVVHDVVAESITNEVLSYFGAPFEVVDRYELGRFITPYGIGLDLDEGWTWVYDVTDFAPLLKGTVELEAGNWQELLDMKFAFIEGTPPREVKRVERLWAGSFGLSTFNENISPKTILVEEDEESFRLKATTSGHQFDNGTNCAEFCYKIHSVLVDGETEYSWQIMEECADNPLYPQGGTWIYDRAGWCPGAPVTTQDLEITPFVTDDSFDVDYAIQSDQFGNYVFEGYMISYGASNYVNDVEVSEIISPSTWKLNSRVNPMCNNPIVKIRNNGSNPLLSCEFEYGVNGQLETYTWTGNLGFMESEEVELAYADPVMWSGDEDEMLEFEVTVDTPNGSTDENPSNNSTKSNFKRPPHYYYDGYTDNRLIIWLRTNLSPQESSYSIYDLEGNVVYERDDFTTPSFSHKDTIPLDPGCYLFHLKDAADDGLSFFANNDGTGYCRLKKVSSSELTYFPGNFGKEIFHYFSWNIDPLNLPQRTTEAVELKVYPNPAHGVFNIELGMNSDNVSLEILDLRGQVIHRREGIKWSKGFSNQVDLSNYPDGVYLLRLFDGQIWRSTKLLKQ